MRTLLGKNTHFSENNAMRNEKSKTQNVSINFKGKSFSWAMLKNFPAWIRCKSLTNVPNSLQQKMNMSKYSGYMPRKRLVDFEFISTPSCSLIAWSIWNTKRTLNGNIRQNGSDWQLYIHYIGLMGRKCENCRNFPSSFAI